LAVFAGSGRTAHRSQKRPLKEQSGPLSSELGRIRLDTMVGMACSNLIAIAIIVTTAATLHSKGVTDIQSSAQPRRP
jgi:Mn2+/Fe2+ NRAMP family transporter